MLTIDDKQARRVFICIAIVLLLVLLSNATMRTEGVESAEVIATHWVPGARSSGGSHGIVVVRREDGSTATIDARRGPMPAIGTRIRIERRSDLLGRKQLRIAGP